MLLIHLIGKVGAGKSTYRKHKWVTAPVFDIKDIYQRFGFTPENLKDPDNYAQFTTALEHTLDLFVKQGKVDGEKFGVVESSGINQALNRLIQKYRCRRVWIESEYTYRTEKVRPYAYGLNRRFEQLMAEGKVAYDRKIYVGDY